MGKENFIPLSQANNSNLCEGRLQVNLPLPYGLDEKIEINTHRIDVLRQIAGFSRINLVRDDESGTSSVVPQIDGINRDGTAISSRVKMKTIPEGGSELRNNERRFYNKINWPELNIKLNVEEIQQRLIRKKGVNINNPKPWSESFNRIITDRITIDGVRHLLYMGKVDILGGLLLSGLYSFNSLKYFSSDPIMVAGQIIGGNIYWDVLSSFKLGFEKKGEGYRLSLMAVGPEMDRAVALSVYSRIGSVIRARTEEKK